MSSRKMYLGLVAMSCGALATVASAHIVEIELVDVASWAEQGNDSNWIGNIVIEPDQQIVGFGYDLNLSTFGNSWLSEAAIWIGDASAPDESFVLTPGAGQNVPGQNVDFSTGGIIPLSILGIDPIQITSSSIRFESFETFVDFPDSADAVWSGTIYLDIQPVPAPGVLALLGLGATVTRRRRR